MELNVSQLKRQVQTAILVSQSSIVIPYLLGVTLALFLYERLAQPGASFAAFSLFMGIGMSITAFPVLVRILKARRAVLDGGLRSPRDWRSGGDHSLRDR